jgi:hypothetical protein
MSLDQEIHWLPIYLNTCNSSFLLCSSIANSCCVDLIVFWGYILKRCFSCSVSFCHPSFKNQIVLCFSSQIQTQHFVFLSHTKPVIRNFPLVALSGNVCVGFFLPTFHWHFTHNASFAEVLPLYTPFYRLRFSHTLCHIPTLLTGTACRPVL